MPSKSEVLDHYDMVMSAEKAYLEANESRFMEAADLFETPSQDRFRGLVRSVQTSPTSYMSEPRPSHWLINLALCEESREADGSQRGRDITEVTEALLYPMGGIDRSTETIPGKTEAMDQAVCEEAEKFFSDAAQQVLTGSNQYQARLSVYHTKAGEPLAFRKVFDSSTALLLRDVTLDKGFIPAGTIVGVPTIPKTGQTIRDDRILQAYEVDKQFTISPFRLSAWAYDSALDRALFAIGKEPGKRPLIFDPGRANRLAHYKMTDFIAASQRIIQLCAEDPALVRN